MKWSEFSIHNDGSFVQFTINYCKRFRKSFTINIMSCFASLAYCGLSVSQFACLMFFPCGVVALINGVFMTGILCFVKDFASILGEILYYQTEYWKLLDYSLVFIIGVHGQKIGEG